MAIVALIVLAVAAGLIVNAVRKLRLKRMEERLRNSDDEIQLGDEVRCTLTAYQGIAVVRAEWLHGCVRIGVQTQEMHEGLPREPVHFDAGQLVIVTPNKVEASNLRPAFSDVPAGPPGGPPREGRGYRRP